MRILKPAPAAGRGRWYWLRVRASSSWRNLGESWHNFAENRLALLGLFLIVMFGFMAIAHPVLMATIWPKQVYDPETGYDLEINQHPSPPSAKHLLGTDSLGRDVLSMLLAATTPEFVLGITAAIIAVIAGTAIGMVSAYYYRSVIDTFFTHLADAFLLLPAPLFMVIVGVRFVTEIGPIELGVIYGVLAGLSNVAIVMRSYALTLMTKSFVDACRVAGGGTVHIILRHLVPHVLPLAALHMMLTATGAIVADGFISFFGFERVHLNWGSMIFSSFASSRMLGTGYEWHTLISPSVALSLFAAAFYLIAQGLHELADPRLRRGYE